MTRECPRFLAARGAEGAWAGLVVELSCLWPAPGRRLRCSASRAPRPVAARWGGVSDARPRGLLDSGRKPPSQARRCLGRGPCRFQSSPLRMSRAPWALPTVLNFRKRYLFCFPLLRSSGKMTASRPRKRLEGARRSKNTYCSSPDRCVVPRLWEPRSSAFTECHGRG